MPYAGALRNEGAGHGAEQSSVAEGDGAGGVQLTVRLGRAASGRKPREIPRFKWVSTSLGNLKTMINGAHKNFEFVKHLHRHLGSFAFRFSNRFDLPGLVTRPIEHIAAAGKMPERTMRGAAENHTK